MNRIVGKIIDQKQRRLFEQFRNDVLKIKGADNDGRYDLCVIGSDEVFNCMTPSKWGFTSQLFGNVKQSERVITYAASCGATSLSQLNKDMQEIIRRSFQRVSGFSARDDNTGLFISAMTDKTVQYHFDPVWIANFDDELKATQLPAKLPSRYCVVYSYYNRIYQRKDIEAIQKFCESEKLEPIALGAPQMWIRKYLALSPFEALKVIQGAEFIITDTFHGTIFAEKYNGKYAVMLRDSNANKLMDLIERLELQSHLIQDFSELDSKYKLIRQNDINYGRQEAERIRSMEYLKEYVYQSE